MQIDVDQAAFRVGKVERAEFAPVGERLPVAFLNLDAHQLRTVRVRHPGAVGHPVVIDLIHHILFKTVEIDASEFAAIFHVPQRFIVRGEETTEGVVSGAVGQLGRFLLLNVQQVVVPVALKGAAKDQLAAIAGKAFLIEVVTVTDDVRGRQPYHVVAGLAVVTGTEIQGDDFSFHGMFLQIKKYPTA